MKSRKTDIESRKRRSCNQLIAYILINFLLAELVINEIVIKNKTLKESSLIISIFILHFILGGLSGIIKAIQIDKEIKKGQVS